jgi:DNA repair photolyase
MQSFKIIKEKRKTPILKPPIFGCLKDTPAINIVVSLDEDYRKLFEPFSSPPNKRVSLIRDLIKEGIETSVRVDPLVPPSYRFRGILKRVAKGAERGRY